MLPTTELNRLGFVPLTNWNRGFLEKVELGGLSTFKQAYALGLGQLLKFNKKYVNQ